VRAARGRVCGRLRREREREGEGRGERKGKRREKEKRRERRVVISGAFIKNLLHKSQRKYKIIICFSGEAKDSVNFSFFFCFISFMSTYTPLVSISQIIN